MAEETTTPAETVAPAPTDTVITPTALENNEFSSEQLAEAIENMKAGKLHKETPKPAETPKEEVKVETPATPTEPVKEPEAVAPVTPEPSFDEKVATAVEAKIKELGIVKPEPVVVKPEDEFHGFKTAEELNQAYEKDPVGTFNKVVAKQVKAEMEAFKAEVNQGLQPIRQDLENRTVSTHLNEAKAQVKEMADPAFMKNFNNAWKANPIIVDNAIKTGKNPYVEVAKLVRGENVSNYEKQAYDRGVKETEARLGKASRAVVEGGGKVIVATEGIDLEKASSAEILAELKRHGKA